MRLEENGLKIINQLFDGEIMKPFSELYDRFNLKTNNFFRYLQLWHYIKSLKHWDTIEKIPTNVDKYFSSINEHGQPIKNHIAHIYRKLLQDQSNETFHIKRKWELELNTIIDDEMWTKVCVSCHKDTSSQMCSSPLSQCLRECER